MKKQCAGKTKNLVANPVFVTLLALSSAGCTGSGHSALYTGTLQPNGGTCDPPAQAALQVQNEAVMFTPNLGTLTLRGTLGANGAIKATLTVIGAEKKPYELTFENAEPYRPNMETIAGRYITPRCTYRVTLRKI